MNDQLITYETAQLLPDKYNKRKLWSFCKWFYTDTTTKLGYFLADVNDLDVDYPAPTQTAMIKWFREEHKLHIGITVNQFGYGYMYSIIDLVKCDCIVLLTGGPDHRFTYEEAIERAIQQALKLIKP